METLILGAENNECLLNGVSTAMLNLEQTVADKYHVIRVRPYYPDTPYNKSIWELPSIELSHWVPDCVATIDEGYRCAKAYATPVVGRRINDDLLKKLDYTNPDMIHLHGTHQVSEHLAKAALRLGLRYGLTLHTCDDMYLDERVHIPALREYLKREQAKRSLWLANNAAFVTCPTKWYEKHFRKQTGYTGHMIIMGSFVSEPVMMAEDEWKTFNNEFRSQLAEQSRNRPLIGCLGRVSPEKNIKFALRTMATLKRIYTEKNILNKLPVLIVAGPGPNDFRDELVTLVEEFGLIIGIDILFLGGQKPAQMMRIMQICLMLIFPARTETEGLMRKEAQFCGAVPIVLQGTALAENFHSRLILPENENICAMRIYNLLCRENEQDEIMDLRRTLYDMIKPVSNRDAYFHRITGLYRLARRAA